MKRSAQAKFPASAQLFKFCQKVMHEQRKGKRVHDQEVGAILSFNPSDCSHWKRGEKSVRSVFALEKLSQTLKLETAILHDIVSGHSGLNEAFYEYQESRTYSTVLQHALAEGEEAIATSRAQVEAFVKSVHNQCEFETPPLYLPEVLRFFSFVSTQPTDMLDKLSRILRVRPGQYCIQFCKGELKPQTRMSMSRDLARIIFEGERERFPELGAKNENLVELEEMIFVANLLVPKHMLAQELAKLDVRRNVVSDLANLFWVPKSLVGFQMQEMVRTA